MTSPAPLSASRTRFALFALSLGGFAIGSTEFVAMGLLPDIAQSMLPGLYRANAEAANAQAGLIVSAYALGVVVGAPTIAAFAARLPRKRLLMWCTLAFTLATVCAALAPTFPALAVFRFVCGLPHGAYFGIAALVAGDLMGEGKRARGVALVLGGLAVANVVGVPAITWIGQVANWRVAYAVVAALFALTFVAVAFALPLRPGRPEQTFRRELRAFTKPHVWFAIGMGAIGFGGFFALYTYVAPIVTEVSGLPSSAVPIALVVCGAGMVVGNALGGRLADHNLRWTIILSFAALGVALLLTGFVVRMPALVLPAIFLVGLCGSGIAPGVQVRLFDVAHESQTIAGAIHHSAFNLGNSLGAYLGGVVIAAGFGYEAPIWLGVGLSCAGVVIAATSFGLEARSRRAATRDERGVPLAG